MIIAFAAVIPYPYFSENVFHWFERIKIGSPRRGRPEGVAQKGSPRRGRPEGVALKGAPYQNQSHLERATATTKMHA